MEILKKCALSLLVAGGISSAYSLPAYYIGQTYVLPKNHLNISFTKAKLDYEEKVDGKVIDGDYADYGDLYGIFFKYVYDIDDDSHFFIQSKYISGTTEYIGQTQDGTPVTETTNNMYIWNSKIGYSGTLASNERFYTLGFEAGAGYRFWKRGYDSSNPSDYREDYKWYYGFLGLNYNLKMTRYIDLNLYSNMNYAIDPSLKVYLGSGTTLDLGTTYGYNYGVNVKFYFSDLRNTGFSFGYEKTYWNISKSSMEELDGYSIYEPDSITRMYELSINYFYAF